MLKPTGSLYLHCDPSASHYLKILLDSIFSATNFKNEIVWKRSAPKGHAYSRFPTTHDVILSYDKGDFSTWNAKHTEYDEKYVRTHYSNVEPETGRRYQLDNTLNPNPNRPNLTYEWNGHTRVWRWTKEKMKQMHEAGRLVYTNSGMPRYKRYLDEMPGSAVTDFWEDIPPINSQADERLGYQTQKPLALLERIISASSNEDDLVLDPFCGCGTTVHAAQKLKRQWIGIDVTHLAIALIERRLKEAFPGIAYEVHGVPKDADAARDLAERDKHEFQKWIVATVGGQPYKGGKKGMDRGIDGYLHFRDADNKPQLGIISVKGGATNSGHVRDLKGTMEREDAKLGVFLTLNPPTREMEREAASAGLYDSGGGKVPRLQILTAANVIDGKRPQVPFGHTESLKKASRETEDQQGQLL